MGLLWAMSLPGLVVALVVFAALERFGVWTRGVSWIPWRRKRDAQAGLGMSAVAFDQLGAVFSGAKQDEIEYRQMSLMLRDETGDNAPPRTTVDLDGYGVRVVLPEKES
ncbi:DUF6191 domain-containing protein [Actinokineospora inagensis]|uniref:DUF6191 domain-containing protein n=1 Tax=Actinokineospora inagensis TaxID=103730 RepID=UPI0003FB30DE|nr:DUF6191 domain-containing protein [Actinokineospora inagensis]